MTCLTLERKRELALRVNLGGYYTDGDRLYEPQGLGATGCVVLRDCCTGEVRCIAIDEFRAGFWLVATMSVAA